MAKSILIIDDSSVNNILLENILSEQGFDVATTFNASQAFNKINEKTPDLILLDIMMPGINGHVILEQLKADLQTKSIPVIMVSAKSDSADIQRSLELGAHDHIVKPINIKGIVDKIRNILN